MPTRKRKLTEADRKAAARVRELWADYKKKNPGVSQDTAAALAGFTQSAFSQFILGRVPIGLKPALSFAKLFGVSPTAIREDLGGITYAPAPPKAPLTARESDADGLTREGVEVAKVFQRLGPQTREQFRELLFIYAAVDKHYPWLRRGRPQGESYDQFEKRHEQNMAAKIELAAARQASSRTKNR